MGYGRLRALTPPVRNGGEAGKKRGQRGGSQQFVLATSSHGGFGSNSGKRAKAENPAGFGVQPPCPHGWGRVGVFGGAPTLQLSPNAPEYRSCSLPGILPSGCAEGLTEGRERGAGEGWPWNAEQGMDGHPAGVRDTRTPAGTRDSPAGCSGAGGGGGWPRTSLSILHAPAASQRAEETQIATERRLSQGLSRPCPLVPSARRQKSPRAIASISLQPQQLPALCACSTRPAGDRTAVSVTGSRSREG